MRSSSRSTCTLHLRSSRSSVTARCTSPLTPRIVWCVSSSRATVSEGSSSHSRCRRRHQLVVVGPGRRLDRHLQRRRRQRGRRHHDGLALGGEGVAGARPVEAGHRHEVARRDGRRRRRGVPGDALQRVQPLLLPGARVDQDGVGLQRARDHLAERHLAGVAVVERLGHGEQRRARSGRTGISAVSVPAVARTGGREAGLGQSSSIRRASRSTPTPLAAEQHSTGKTLAEATPPARLFSSSA